MLSERLRELMMTYKITKEELAEKCDLPLETVRNVYYGKTTDPKVSTLIKIADYFGISVNCLLGKCQHTPDERKLLQYYRLCGNHGKKILLINAKFEAVTAKYEREAVDSHTIPCLFPDGEIRHGIDYNNCRTEDIWTTNAEADVAICMTNNDLSPKYCKDDIILINERFPHEGEYGAFYYKGKTYIRQYLESDGKYVLKCLHKYDKDMVFERLDEIEYLGTCCGVVRS